MRIEAHKSYVSHLSSNNIGRNHFCSIGNDKNLLVCDTRDPSNPLATIDLESKCMTISSTWSPSTIALGMQIRNLALLDWICAKMKMRIRFGGAFPNSVQALPSIKRMLLIGPGDESALLSNSFTGKIVKKLHTGFQWIIMVCPLESKRYVACASVNSMVVIDLYKGKRVSSMKGTSFMFILKQLQDPDYVINGTYEGVLQIWNWKTGSRMRELVGHETLICAVNVVNNYNHIISTSEDCTVRMWDWKEGICIIVIRLSDVATSMCFLNEQRFLCLGMNKGQILVVSSDLIKKELPSDPL
jgi:WD40 repeat protein